MWCAIMLRKWLLLWITVGCFMVLHGCSVLYSKHIDYLHYFKVTIFEILGITLVQEEGSPPQQVPSLAEADSLGLPLSHLLPIQGSSLLPPPGCLPSPWTHIALHPGDDEPGIGSHIHKRDLSAQAPHYHIILNKSQITLKNTDFLCKKTD